MYNAGAPGRKKPHFREINISAKMAEFVNSIGNPWICAVNHEISKNLISIGLNSQYQHWPVNGEPSNTIGTLELLFPIFKKFVLFHFKKDHSFYIPKSIILVLFQKASFLFRSKKKSSSFVPKRIVHVTLQNVFLFCSKKDCLFLVSLWLV